MATKKTVLIAEDDANDVLFLRRAFAKAKVMASLRFVHDGQEAVDYLKGEGSFADRLAHPLPDLVMLDHKMPRMDGSAVLEWVRKQAHLSRLPVIILSSSSLKADIDRAYQLGADSYMVKPQELRKLCEMAEVVKHRWLSSSSDQE
jgi:CheY-like chemotaxis protein